MNLYLDDIRTPSMSHNNTRGLASYSDKNRWVIVRTYNEFIKKIKNNFNEIDLISFDHDISSYDKYGNEMTGKDAANFVIDYCLDNDKKFPNWYVHSDKMKILNTYITFVTYVTH